MEKDHISWQSKKQSIVATSTAEAKYIVMTECIKKGLNNKKYFNRTF